MPPENQTEAPTPAPAPAKPAAKRLAAPWTINFPHGGSRAGILAEIAKAQATDHSGKPEGVDQTQIEAAKAYLTAVINAIPAEFNGVKVNAEGHSDDRCMFHATVIRCKLV